MPDPKTPLKADEGINRIISDLSVTWRLELPIRDKNWSPAKHDVQTVEQQIYSSVRFLFFKDPPALEAAINQFRRQAPSINSKWRFKPLAEADVIPSRTRLASARREESLVDQVEKDEKAIAELRECLLEKVQNACKDFNNRKSREDARRSETLPTTAVNHTMHQGQLSRYLYVCNRC